ncbi:hypothetical protein IC744_14025 [Microbacterium hominis]|uniref:hypothetical protein n=1 Tax=Microbacterium TaxID=33882 RepID=UPI00168B1015|nr:MULTISPECIES: hypothetical protein [Microbacterium]QOC24398.1 hypothetical protein IC745_08265 [Microbacterium hominis]QOC28476.1 hypothetical protein IC744_14025 [Microbacterium hominis]QYF96321.1 hypothetical protein KY498_08880 [Microbacterium sp. PAMC21962]
MRISLLIDSPLTTLMHVMRGLDTSVRRQVIAQSKRAALPIWQEETRFRGDTRQRSRLAQSAAVGITATNITLKAGAGPLSATAALPELAKAIEFGNNPFVKEQVVSKRGKVFTRRRGNRFGPATKTGNVAYPAAQQAIPRVTSVIVQTAVRTIHEEIETVN